MAALHLLRGEYKTQYLDPNIIFLSDDNASPRFVLGEVFVGTLVPFAGAPPRANDV